MQRGRQATLALISTTLALAAAWWLWPHVRAALEGRGEVEFVRPPDSGTRPPELSLPDDRTNAPLLPGSPERWRYHLDEPTARRVFVLREDEHVYDPWTYYRRQAGLEREYRWPEHPGGAWLLRTNSLGLREDRELAGPPAEVRVLVAGDSHTYGACNNDESWPALLEASLGDRLGRSTEVLNAAMDGHSLFHYFGTLHRFRSFAPQVFVVAVFGGNDFSEISYLHHLFSGTPQQSWPPEALEARDAAISVGRGPMGQCFNSIQMFRTLPEEIPTLTRAAVELTGEIAATCAALEIELVVVLIPAPCSLAWDDAPPALGRVRDALQPSADDDAINRSMEASYVEGVRALGVHVVDLFEPFSNEPQPPYWRRDLHVDLRGHTIIRDQLLPGVAELFE